MKIFATFFMLLSALYSAVSNQHTELEMIDSSGCSNLNRLKMASSFDLCDHGVEKTPQNSEQDKTSLEASLAKVAHHEEKPEETDKTDVLTPKTHLPKRNSFIQGAVLPPDLATLINTRQNIPLAMQQDLENIDQIEKEQKITTLLIALSFFGVFLATSR